MIITPYIPDYVQAVVTAVSAALNRPVYFQKGNVLVVQNNLIQLDGSEDLKDKKYPFIWLVLDLKELRRAALGLYADISLNLYILTHSDPDYTMDQRRDINFLPILYPIYAELLSQLANSQYFKVMSAETIQHEKTDLHHWGVRNQNVFVDYMDGIQIRDLKLSVSRKIIC